MTLRTIDWAPDSKSLTPGHVVMIDQTRLPDELVYLHSRDVTEVWTAIRTLQVRGAPAIGIAAAMGIVVAIQDHAGPTESLHATLLGAADYLATSRPTAVNLFWALNRMKSVARYPCILSPQLSNLD